MDSLLLVASLLHLPIMAPPTSQGDRLLDYPLLLIIINPININLRSDSSVCEVHVAKNVFGGLESLV